MLQDNYRILSMLMVNGIFIDDATPGGQPHQNLPDKKRGQPIKNLHLHNLIKPDNLVKNRVSIFSFNFLFLLYLLTCELLLPALSIEGKGEQRQN